MATSLFRKKSIEKILRDAEEGVDAHHHSLNKVLTVRDLTFMGIAAVVGAGIFSTIGTASSNGGPGISLLFVLTAITCGFSALCYAEFASRVPIAGSAYTYAYVSFGELIAWIIGWALILEYAIGNIVVAISWSSYFHGLLEGMNIHLPGWLTTDFATAKKAYLEVKDAAITPENQFIIDAWKNAPEISGYKIFLNLPAFIIVCLISILTYVGIKESKKSANFMVIFKIAVIIFVIVVGFFYVKPSYWNPFLPNGFEGVLKGVSAVFYAYIGFDAISTTAEECRNPQRDLPKGMIYSLVICTVLYILIALVLTGMVHYSRLDVKDPLADVFKEVGQDWISYIVAISAVVATTSVLLVFQLGQPRIWMGMSRDGLLPRAFGKVHKKYHTPYFSTIVTGLIVAIPSLFMESSLVTDLTSIGTLFAFVLVSAGVLMLPRIDRNNNKGGFKLPYINGKIIVPVLAIAFIALFSERISSAFQYKILGKKVETEKPLGGTYQESTVEAIKTGKYINADSSITYKDSAYTQAGVLITAVDKGSSLDRLDLKPNDLITEVNDSTIATVADLKKVVNNLPQDENIKVKYVNNKKTKTTTLTKNLQAILFLFFAVLLLPIIAILTFVKNFSVIPILGVLFCAYLLIEIPAISWMWFFVWMAVGLLIYFLYGYRRSKLSAEPQP